MIDLNTLNNELDNYISYFDYIIVADVLEHLINPLPVLNKLKNYLNKSGKIIISLPNISHCSIKLSLLNGTFNYYECGILDETHLRFFDIHNAIKLATDASLKVSNISRTFSEVDYIEPKAYFREYSKNIVEYATKDYESFTLQFIITLENPIDDLIKEHNKAWLLNREYLKPKIQEMKENQYKKEHKAYRKQIKNKLKRFFRIGKK